MIRYAVLQLLFLVSSMTSQVIGMQPIRQQSGIAPSEEKKEIAEGIAQRIEELPKELRYDIFSSALALRENPKYEVYKKLDVGSLVRGIALNADNKRALTCSDDGIVRIWDVEKGIVLKELKGHTASITSVALSADGKIAFTVSYDRTARVWDMNTGELLKTIHIQSGLTSVALSADGTLALIGDYESIVRLYNTGTGELLKVLQGHKESISSVALSADGTRALTGSLDGTARVWDTKTGATLKILKPDSVVNSVALSADGTSALTGTDEKVLVWDAQSGALLNTLLTQSQYIYAVAVSKDGKRALVGTHEGNVQIWNTKPLPGQKETNTPLTVLAGHTGPVTAIAFGSDDFIASGSTDGTALIWKSFALEPRGPQEHQEILRQAYKETFSRPLLRSENGN